MYILKINEKAHHPPKSASKTAEKNGLNSNIIEDSADEYLPNDIPNADIAIVSEIHNDLLLELLPILEDSRIKAVIVPQESAAIIARPQIEEICDGEGIERVFSKPFCDLHLKPEADKPVIRKFVTEFRIGRPELRVEGDS